MNEKFLGFDPDIVAASVQTANDAIESQNNRYKEATQLDPDFGELVIGSLRQEQEASVADRHQMVAALDYTELGKNMVVDDAERERVLRNLEEKETTVSAVHEQARLSTQLAPSAKEAIQALAEAKSRGLVEEIDLLRTNLAELQARESGYEALGAAWVIPRVSQPEIRIDVVEDTTTLAEVEPEVPIVVVTANVGAESVDEAEPVYEGLNPIFQRVIAGVIAYAADHSQVGVRSEEIRREVPEVAALTREEYDYFKDHLNQLREYAQELLVSNNVEATWRVSGQRRGTRYHFDVSDVDMSSQTLTEPTEPDGEIVDVVTDAQEDAPLSATEVVTKPAPEIKISAEEVLKVPIAAYAFDFVASNIKTRPEKGPLRRNYALRELSRRLVREFEVEPEVAEVLLGQLVAAGLLYEYRSRGVKVVSTSPQPEDSKRSSSTEDGLDSAEVDDVDDEVDDEASASAIEQPAKEIKLNIFKHGVRTKGGSGNTFLPIEVESVAKAFGIKDKFGLGPEVEKWVTWLAGNAFSPASKKIMAFKGINIGTTFNAPLWRFSPNDCTELSVDPKFRRYRIAYTMIEDEVVLVDILHHDDFDKKYK